MGLECSTLKIDSIVIVVKKSKYYVNILYTSPWGNMNCGSWAEVRDDILKEVDLSYYEFKKILKTFNGKFDKHLDIYFNSQEEAEAWRNYLEGNLIMNKIIK